MWRRLHDALRRLWRRSRSGPTDSPTESPTERRLAHDRARFWAEVRQGEREAEANSRP